LDLLLLVESFDSIPFSWRRWIAGSSPANTNAQAAHQYRFAMGSSSAGNSVMTRQRDQFASSRHPKY